MGTIVAIVIIALYALIACVTGRFIYVVDSMYCGSRCSNFRPATDSKSCRHLTKGVVGGTFWPLMLVYILLRNVWNVGVKRIDEVAKESRYTGSR